MIDIKQVDELIVDLIKSKSVSKQSDLLVLLHNNKVKITQPNLSRRMERLQIKKEMGYYVLPAKVELKNTQIKSIDLAPPNLMVIHTLSGFAGSIAAQIDQIKKEKNSKLSSVLGTIAGDDTILLIAKNAKKLQEIHKQIIYFFSQINA